MSFKTRVFSFCRPCPVKYLPRWICKLFNWGEVYLTGVSRKKNIHSLCVLCDSAVNYYTRINYFKILPAPPALPAPLAPLNLKAI